MTDDGPGLGMTRLRYEPASLRTLLTGNGPRLLRDAVGPVAVFYLGWKTLGLVAGILGATAVTTAAFAWERRRGRTGLGAGIGLFVALVQALSGLLSGSARWYFVPAVAANAVGGLAFLGSVVVERPLAGVFAAESYPFPPEVRASSTFRRVFTRISLVWAAYFLSRAALRLVLLVSTSIEAFLLVSVATGVPLTAAITTWSFWYAVRAFRRRLQTMVAGPGAGG